MRLGWPALGRFAWRFEAQGTVTTGTADLLPGAKGKVDSQGRSTALPGRNSGSSLKGGRSLH